MTPDTNLDFGDLESLLAEANQRQEAVAAGKVAKKRLIRGGLRSEDHEDALFAVRAAESITTWHDVAVVAIVQDTHCTSCGSVSENLLGFFQLRRHQRDVNCKSITRIKDYPVAFAPTAPIYHGLNLVSICSKCLHGAKLDDALLVEFNSLASSATVA